MNHHQRHDLITWLRAVWDSRERELDEDERTAQEASRRRDSRTPTGEHWHWVETEHDQAMPLDPMLDEYIGGGTRVSLRSTEEYPTNMPYTLPHFVIPEVDEVTAVCGMHIARWDPARVLREIRDERADITAKRQILDLASDVTEMSHDTADSIVRLLGEPHADLPGYRQEWAP